MVSLSYVWFLTTSRKLKIASSQNIRVIKKAKNSKTRVKKGKRAKEDKEAGANKIQVF